MVVPGKTECAVISSTVSTNIHKIVFTSPSYRMPHTLLDNLCMLSLNDILHGLVRKLRTMGYKHTLEIEFRLESVISIPV